MRYFSNVIIPDLRADGGGDLRVVRLYGLGDVRGGGVEAVLVRGPVHHVGLAVRADIGVAAAHHHHLCVVNHLVQQTCRPCLTWMVHYY